MFVDHLQHGPRLWLPMIATGHSVVMIINWHTIIYCELHLLHLCNTEQHVSEMLYILMSFIKQISVHG